MATKKEVLICRGVNSPLLKCVGTKLETDFYDNWNVWDGKKTCFCKDCLNKIFNIYMEQSNSEKVALYYTCMQINLPFMNEIYNILSNKVDKNGKPQKVNISKYITELQKRKVNKSVWKDFSNTDVTLIGENKVKTFDKDDVSKLEIAWGIQDDIKDYYFLEETFKRYTENREELNPQQEDLFRDLSRDRLLLRKINDGRYNGDETIDKVQSRISKLMGILKLDQFEQPKKKSDIEKILEHQIWEIENEEPAEVIDKNEYSDFLDINKNWGKHILRCVKNLLVGSKEYPNITRDSDKY